MFGVEDGPVYADRTLNFFAYGMITDAEPIQRINPHDVNSYIFLGELATRYNLAAPFKGSKTSLDLDSSAEVFFNKNRIYANGNAGVLY